MDTPPCSAVAPRWYYAQRTTFGVNATILERLSDWRLQTLMGLGMVAELLLIQRGLSQLQLLVHRDDLGLIGAQVARGEIGLGRGVVRGSLTQVVRSRLAGASTARWRRRRF